MEAKQGHTPGPWRLQPGTGGSQDVWGMAHIAVARVYAVDSPRRWDPAKCEGEANAALIAAAPDLRAALDYIAAKVEAGTSEMTRREFERDIVDRARAALAKAGVR